MRDGDPHPMRLQLWSYNYPPEPTGIAPVSAVWASELSARGFDVEVVAAHPHYPAPIWTHPRGVYRERIHGVRVTRLPLSVGRGSGGQRLRQELSFAVSQFAASPMLARPDVLVAVSPSFPALLPAMVTSTIWRVPLVVWLQDVLPDGAVSTGLLRDESLVVRAARALETSSYSAARRIVVVSRAFVGNLREKGVPPGKIDLIYNPPTRIGRCKRASISPSSMQLLSMGNIGHSQGLARLVANFEQHDSINREVRLIITGTGVAADSVRSEIRTNRVKLRGVLSSDALEAELLAATAGLVSQEPGGQEFNLPSKLMNFMAYGIPVLAVVESGSEVASIVRTAGCGWVVDPREPSGLSQLVAALQDDPDAVSRKGVAGKLYAERNFSREAFGDRFAACLRAATVYQSDAPKT